MSFERVSAGTGIGAEPPATPGPGIAGATEDISPALRLQILSTEHWSLLATRSLAWNETFSRAGMFLSTLSGAMVALALVAQASMFGSSFVLFALAILPVVLLVGVATFVRLGSSNYYDAMCVVGMNRIRGAYLELAPDLGRYFVMSAHDDAKGVATTMGVPPGMRSGLHVIAATPFVISTLNAVIAGVIASLLGLEAGAGTMPSLVIGALAFGATVALQQRYARANVARVRSTVQPAFPTPTDPRSPATRETM
jgi:hypothetical protein